MAKIEKISQGHKTGVQGIVVESADVKPKVCHVKQGRIILLKIKTKCHFKTKYIQFKVKLSVKLREKVQSSKDFAEDP